MVVGDDLFHQHVFLVAGQQRLDVAHLQRLSGRKAGISANDGGQFGSGASPPARGWAIVDKAPMELLYQDEHFIAVNKPSGFHVHPPENPELRVPRDKIMLYHVRKMMK